MALDRRTFLRTGLVAGGVVGGGVALGSAGWAAKAPALVRGGRPRLTHGVQSGDVTAHEGVVWARADQPARMLVDVSTRPDFRDARTVRGPFLTPETDLTGKTFLTGLPSGRQIHYRVRLDTGRLLSAPTTGGFRTAARDRQDIRFVWSGDLAGQGWGINPEFGGYKIFRAMGAVDPDFFLCSGDWIYADGPITEAVTLPDGSVWRNITAPEKAKVAETLAEYRGNYRYNLQDASLRAFAAKVPMVYQWDDHEVLNNWYPGEILTDPQYTEKRVDVLAGRARRAALEYMPIAITATKGGRTYRKIEHGPLLDVFMLDMRTYKDANDANGSTDPRRHGLLGAEQLAWLKRELRASKATWKVIAADLPIGLVVPDGTAQEAAAQGDPGAPLGREREIADLLSYAKRHRVRGMVWLTADVHYTAAHYYDPAKAAFSDFDPFWEFVSGPLNAGGFGPNALDPTFGPQLRFVKTPPAANSSPAEGYQFFGEVAIDAGSKVLTVRLRDLTGVVLFSTDLDPVR